jgi:hypothetical protein
MARLFKNRQEYPKLNFDTVISVLEYANEPSNTTLSAPMTLENNRIKTMLSKGGVRVSFPDTDEPPVETSEIGRVFPGPAPLGKMKFSTVGLVDDTQFVCIQPYPNYMMSYVTQDLEAGGALALPVGYLAYVFGSTYTVNDNPCTSDMVFAVENNQGVLRAQGNCRVVMFTARLM